MYAIDLEIVILYDPHHMNYNDPLSASHSLPRASTLNDFSQKDHLKIIASHLMPPRSLLWVVFIPLLITFIVASSGAKTLRGLPLQYPLQAPPSVSSTFGTYRINHHHAGIDLYAYEGTPVLAAADGVVSRIKRGSGGYGRAIYLKHSGGYLTLYAHLSAFSPKIESIIRKRELKTGTFSLKLNPRKKLRFKAGEVIGWSGSSGTDLMHLHFELRYKSTPLNPLTHGLNLPDTQPPVNIALHAYPISERAFVSGGVTPIKVPLNPWPERISHPATALRPPPKTSTPPPPPAPTDAAASPSGAAPPSSDTALSPDSVAESPPIPLPPQFTIWGDVGLSVEVEDRIDGSARELTPYEIMLIVDGRTYHHLQYNQGTYSDKRSTELDYDLNRRGAEKRLVHRLYRFAHAPKALKRSKKSPLKRLKRGVHQAKVISIDAAGHRSVTPFVLNVERPTPISCTLKRKRIKRKRKQPWLDIDSHMIWRTEGLSINLDATECEGDTLKVDVRFDGRSAPRRAVSLTRMGTSLAVSVHLDRVDIESLKKGKKKDKKKDKKEDKKEDKEEAPLLDRSLSIWVGVEGLKGQEEARWYRLKVHHVAPEAHFEGRGVHVSVGEESLFSPYFTTISKRQAPTSPGIEALTPLYRFAQPWHPMRAANEVLIPLKKRRRSRHTGAYLHGHGRWWWVSLEWLDRGISASSTHLAEFAILRDLEPPKVGDAQWDLSTPRGPRLIIPISDQGSGLGRVKLFIDDAEVPIEVQSSWSRVIYRPLTSISQGEHRASLSVKDRSGRAVERRFTLTWPPPKEELIDLSTLRKLTPDEPL